MKNFGLKIELLEKMYLRRMTIYLLDFQKVTDCHIHRKLYNNHSYNCNEYRLQGARFKNESQSVNNLLFITYLWRQLKACSAVRYC